MEHATSPAIEAATPRDARALRALCPDLYRPGAAPDRVLVARDAQGAIAGLAALAWRAHDRPPGFPLHVHVHDAWRRRGIGRALAVAAARACAADTDRVHAWHALDDDDPGAAFARAVGCTALRRVLDFEAALADLLGVVHPLHARIHRAMPGGARIVALADAPAGAVADLVSSAFGSRREVVLAAMDPRTPHPYDPHRSAVLLVDGAVEGALLGRFIDGVPHVDVNVVAPARRHGWANVALLHRAVSQASASGAQRFRFRCEDTVRDTVRLARRVNARRLGSKVHFTAPVSVLQAS